MEKPKSNIKHISLRIDADLLRRFDYVAEYDGRSMNSELIYLIRKYISQIESKNGKIELPKKE